jgi:hypothetical protein
VHGRGEIGGAFVVPVLGGAGVLEWICNRWREARAEERGDSK